MISDGSRFNDIPVFSLHHIPHSGLYSTITPQPN